MLTFGKKTVSEYKSSVLVKKKKKKQWVNINYFTILKWQTVNS